MLLAPRRDHPPETGDSLGIQTSLFERIQLRFGKAVIRHCLVHELKGLAGDRDRPSLLQRRPRRVQQDKYADYNVDHLECYPRVSDTSPAATRRTASSRMLRSPCLET